MVTISVYCFQLLILGLGDGDISIKNKNTNILCDGNHSVLWYGVKTVVNFMRHLTSVNVLCLVS
jgi:hypothetical protein